MDAPVCRTCGTRHWSRLCNDVATKPVARNEDVALQSVNEKPVSNFLMSDLERENELLRLEVARLRAELSATPQTVKPVPMTATERSRKLRARQRELRDKA
jgi:hypothetical protein